MLGGNGATKAAHWMLESLDGLAAGTATAMLALRSFRAFLPWLALSGPDCFSKKRRVLLLKKELLAQAASALEALFANESRFAAKAVLVQCAAAAAAAAVRPA
ncbi:MAG: hypothetical protein KA752_06900 [Giesbergeria sp.]|nr:hypothetical protein [Giesbergeria sp.]